MTRSENLKEIEQVEEAIAKVKTILNDLDSWQQQIGIKR